MRTILVNNAVRLLWDNLTPGELQYFGRVLPWRPESFVVLQYQIDHNHAGVNIIGQFKANLIDILENTSQGRITLHLIKPMSDLFLSLRDMYNINPLVDVAFIAFENDIEAIEFVMRLST